MKNPLRIHKAQMFVLDGIDGSGKSTLSRALAQHLRLRGLEVVLTNQPTALSSGVAVRRIARTNHSPGALRQALLKDRRNQNYKILRTAFQKADVIICDRYFYSTVYQSRSFAQLRTQISAHRKIFPIPALTFLLLPSAIEARRRIISSKRPLDRFEQSIHFYRGLYFSIRKYNEIILVTKNLSLEGMIDLCAAKILMKIGMT